MRVFSEKWSHFCIPMIKIKSNGLVHITSEKKENFAIDSATFCKEIGHRIKTTTFFNFKSLVCSYCEDFY